MTFYASHTRELRVLIVDDFAPMCELVGRSLVSLGISSISMAAGAVDAVQQIKEGAHFDLIIADWNMPNMTGLELLQYVRSEQKLKDTPFLMITAEATKQNLIDAVKAGVSQYIVKPFTPAALEEKIEAILPK